MHIHSAKHARVAVATILLLCGLALALPAAAQDQRLLSTKVADILAQFPANDSAGRDKLADQILALGEPGIAAFAAQLVPFGTGNDTAVRFALNAVVARASLSSEANRALAERAFIAALPKSNDVEVKTFVLRQLRYVGHDASVKAAAPLLTDENLAEPAAQLLFTVKSLAARAALVAALPKAKGPAQVTIVKGLGDLDATEAAAKLVPFTKDANPMMRRTALGSLARIGSPASYQAMVAAAQAADYKYEPGNAVGALLQYARRLGEKKSLATAEKVCRLVMTKTDDPGRLTTRAGALGVLADVKGAAALPDLVKAVDHTDKAYRNAALFKAEKIRGAAALQQWVAKAKKVDAERQAEIIGMLGRQGDPAALPFIRASLGASDPDVVLAAAETLAHMEHAKAAPDLIALLKKAGPETAGRVAGVLAWTIDEKGLDPLAASLDTLQPAARAAAITLIGDKGGKRFAGKIIPLTGDANPEIRQAAFKALDGVVGPNDLPVLLKLLDGGQDAQKASAGSAETPVADVQKAVVAAASQVTPEDTRATPVLDAMKGAAHPERFIELLPQIGGRPALAALTEQFNSSNPALKAAAFRGLVQWKGPEAADQLYTIVSSGDASYKDQAFNGFVRQISSSSLPDAQKVAQLRKVMPFATTPRDKRTVLRAFERAKSMESFLVVASFLDDKDLANDAAGTVMRIALPDPGAKNGLTGPAVREGLNKVLQVLSGPESDYEKENIRVYLRTMPGGEGGPAPSITPQENAEGFVELFNGKNLDGWTGNLVGYKVEDGVMVFDPKTDNSKNIYTAKDYSDFVFRFEFQLTPAANSGVGIRAPREGDAAYVGMEIQVLDDTAPVYATLQPYQYHSSVYGVIPAKRGSLKSVGEWNSEEIWIKGTKIRVTVNGMVTVDGDIAEASQNGTMDHKDHPGLKRTSGAIGFLSHGAVVKFRNIRIKELK